MNVGKLKAAELLCGGQKKNLGIDSRTVCFSWRLQAKTVTGKEYQTAYQIRIRDLQGSVVYLSEKTVSRKQSGVFITIPELKSFFPYLAEIQVWDQDDQPGGFSAPIEFVTGILDEKDWIAEYINASEEYPVDYSADTLWFCKDFYIDRKPDRAFLHVASAGIHEAYLNGKRAGTRLMAPSRSNLENYHRILYVTYDVTEYLIQEENAIGLWLDAGWTRQSGVEPVIAAQLELIYPDRRLQIWTDEKWGCRKSNYTHIGGNYIWYDFGGEKQIGNQKTDWCTFQPDRKDWYPVRIHKIRTLPAADLLEGNDFLENLTPEKEYQEQDSYRADFGEEFTGWIKIEFQNGKKGQTVEIMFADKPEEECSFNQRYQYEFESSQGMFQNKFNYMAGRYLTVRGTGEANIVSVTGYRVGNRFHSQTFFDCSEPLLKKIFDLDFHTFQANTIDGVISDCPHRERLGYGETGISNTYGVGLHFLLGNAFYRNFFRNWRDCQKENGYLPHVAPNYRGGGGIAWGSCLTITLWDYYVYTKDLFMLRENYQAVCLWADYLLKNIREGLLYCPEEENQDLGFLGDWAYYEGDDKRGTPEADFYNNCVTAYVLSCTARISGQLNEMENRQLYETQWERLCQAIHSRYGNQQHEYLDGSARYLAVALCAGVVPENHREEIQKKFLQVLLRKGYSDGGSVGTVFILRALEKIPGGRDAVYQWLRSTRCPGYGYFIQKGYNTMPEKWDISDFAGGSRIHTCYSGIAGWFMRSLAGIKPDPERENTFTISPYFPEKMNWMKAVIDYGSGTLKVQWHRGGKISFELDVPINCNVIFQAPKGYRLSVDGGKKRKLGPGKHCLMLEERKYE